MAVTGRACFWLILALRSAPRQGDHLPPPPSIVWRWSDDARHSSAPPSKNMLELREALLGADAAPKTINRPMSSPSSFC